MKQNQKKKRNLKAKYLFCGFSINICEGQKESDLIEDYDVKIKSSDFFVQP